MAAGNAVKKATPAPDAIRVMILDDHSIVRQGIRSLISNHADLTVVGEAETVAAGVELARSLQPDVLLLDIRMPGGSGIDAIRPILFAAPRTRVLMLSSFDDEEYVQQALQRGAHGFVTKGVSDDTLVNAIRSAQRGERTLSPAVMNRVVERYAEYSREHARHAMGLTDEDMRLLRLLMDGASNSAIAAHTFLSEATVKRKLQEIFRKLGVTTRTQAAAEAVRRNL